MWANLGLANTAIDAIEKNYKQAYAAMIHNIKDMYESAETYRYNMREYVRKLREGNHPK